jgi:hypothetical protein
LQEGAKLAVKMNVGEGAPEVGVEGGGGVGWGGGTLMWHRANYAAMLAEKIHIGVLGWE